MRFFHTRASKIKGVAAGVVLALAAVCLWTRVSAPNLGPWAAQGVDQVHLQVASPYGFTNLVEVDWLLVRREGPAGNAARKFLGEYAERADIATTQAAAEDYAKVQGVPSQQWSRRGRGWLNAWVPDWVDPPLPALYEWRLHAQAEVVRLDDRVLALCCQRSLYEHPGCSSGSGWTAMVSYDMQTGEEIPVRGWLSSSKMEKIVEERATKACQSRVGLPVGAAITTSFPTACALAPEGVRVVFDFYLYRAPVEGAVLFEEERLDDILPITFTIPYAEFEGVIPKRWLPPAP